MILLNGVEIKPTIFPDKTSQVWNVPMSAFGPEGNVVEWRFEHEGEFMHLAQLKDLLRICGMGAMLYLPYLPYARQDKMPSNGTTFALWTFAALLNSLGFERVTAFDPHSEIAWALIERFEAEFPVAQVGAIVAREKYDMVCYPDEGARRKYSARMGFQHIYGEKLRDQKTGQIKKYFLHGGALASDRRILIVDDICDGGATFVHLAKALLEAGASEIGLFVSHGLFTKGVQVLRDAGIQRIFTKEGEIT
jgi:ribose-phosphate pyrophosphokinase